MKRTYIAAALGMAALTVSPLVARQSAHAEIIQLGFILDESGSIGSTNWGTIKSGLATAIGNIPTAGLNQYEVSVVAFSDNAHTVVSPTLVTAASIAGIQALINGDSYSGGDTNYAAAFSQMLSVLTGSSNFQAAGKSYVNFATDGEPTKGGSGGTSDNQAGKNAKAALVSAGIDNISIEGIGSGVDANNLKNNYCYPGPCTVAPTYDFPAHGFFIAISDATGYAAAIAQKIQVVTCEVGCGPIGNVPTDVPEPASLALMGMGLLGLGYVSRRRRPEH